MLLGALITIIFIYYIISLVYRQFSKAMHHLSILYPTTFLELRCCCTVHQKENFNQYFSNCKLFQRNTEPEYLTNLTRIPKMIMTAVVKKPFFFTKTDIGRRVRKSKQTANSTALTVFIPILFWTYKQTSKRFSVYIWKNKCCYPTFVYLPHLQTL